MEASDPRTRILLAALELFTEHGHEATTYAMIAARADSDEKTVASTFPETQSLLRQALDPDVIMLVAPDVFAAQVSYDHAWDSLHECLLSVMISRLDCARRHLPLTRLLAQEISNQPELFQRYADFSEPVFGPRFTAMMQRFESLGQVGHVDDYRVTRHRFLSLIGAAIRRGLATGTWDSIPEIDQVVTTFIRSLPAPSPASEAPPGASACDSSPPALGPEPARSPTPLIPHSTASFRLVLRRGNAAKISSAWLATSASSQTSTLGRTIPHRCARPHRSMRSAAACMTFVRCSRDSCSSQRKLAAAMASVEISSAAR